MIDISVVNELRPRCTLAALDSACTPQCTQGGAIDQNLGGYLDSRGCTFIGNAARFGGAISGGRDAYLHTHDVTFASNTAQFAGAIECLDCSEVKLNRCVWTCTHPHAYVCRGCGYSGHLPYTLCIHAAGICIYTLHADAIWV